MIRTMLTWVLLAAALLFPGDGFPAKWIIPKNETAGAASQGNTAAYVALEPAEGADSAWTFHVPVRRIPKGTPLEFDFTLLAREGEAEHYCAAYFDGRKWVPVKEFHAYSTEVHPAVQLITFRPRRTIRKELRLRILPLESAPSARLHVAPFTGAYIQRMPRPEPADTLRVLVIGNSNTYYNFSASLIKEIAWSQGMYLEMEVSTKGGRTFAHHGVLRTTGELIGLGGYDAAILQNNTIPMTTYGLDPEGNPQLMEDCVKLAGKVRAASPGCRILIERGWSYAAKDYGGAGSYEAMDEAVARAARLMADAVGGRPAPVGEAAMRVRSERPEINLYQSDNAHPSLCLSYLKACVYYLLLRQMTTGDREPAFRGDPPAFGIDPPEAAWLREVAVDAVRGNGPELQKNLAQ